MIKAIETKYKGYRFRSRLEARWAVFFDALGLEWEYEPEGYDLGDLGWYLPDFYLPEEKIWVEVKPDIDTERLSVYLAGKIRMNCWRHEISNLRGVEEDFSSPFEWEAVGSSVNSFVDITGPFFISCDHGCSHGPATHGLGEGGCGGSYGGRDPWAERVVGQCNSAIEKSDSVFVWIDSLDCYATLIECGYAKAKGKSILCAVDVKLLEQISIRGSHELWFLETMSERFGFFDSAKSAFIEFYPESKTATDYRKIEKVAMRNGGHPLIVGGDPMSNRAWGHTFAVRSIYSSMMFSESAAKARAARFEHGETP